MREAPRKQMEKGVAVGFSNAYIKESKNPSIIIELNLLGEFILARLGSFRVGEINY